MRLKKDGKLAINSKAKGGSFELKIAKYISKLFDIEYGKDIRKTPQSGAILCRADLWVRERYRIRFPYFIECKKRENIKLEHSHLDNWLPIIWFNEAKEKLQVDPDYPSNSPVMLIFSRNRWPIYVLVEDKLEDADTKAKFSLMMHIIKSNMYCYLFDEFLDIFKEKSIATL